MTVAAIAAAGLVIYVAGRYASEPHWNDPPPSQRFSSRGCRLVPPLVDWETTGWPEVTE